MLLALLLDLELGTLSLVKQQDKGLGLEQPEGMLLGLLLLEQRLSGEQFFHRLLILKLKHESRLEGM